MPSKFVIEMNKTAEAKIMSINSDVNKLVNLRGYGFAKQIRDTMYSCSNKGNTYAYVPFPYHREIPFNKTTLFFDSMRVYLREYHNDIYDGVRYNFSDTGCSVDWEIESSQVTPECETPMFEEQQVSKKIRLSKSVAKW